MEKLVIHEDKSHVAKKRLLCNSSIKTLYRNLGNFPGEIKFLPVLN